MKKQLGCLSGTGIAAAFAVLIVVTFLLLFSGGSIFNPGGLSAQSSGASLGGVTSHDELSNDCSACHAAPWSADNMSDRCVVCHTAITTELNDPASLHSVMMPDGFIPCRDCHTEHNGVAALLTAVDPQTFPHAQATGFALIAHEQTDDGQSLSCADCHDQNVTEFELSTCDTCHRDLDVAFMESHTTTFGGECLACHDGVDSYGEQFDHARTDFPLEGEHLVAACAECHQNQTSVAALQTTDQACYACHAADDAHGGELGQNCAICHTAQSWETTTFNHALTAFPLLGAHENVECELCHINNQFTGTPADCYGCHQKDDVHTGGLGQKCEACHTTNNWEQTLFTHALTDFQLVGAHEQVACVDCHIDNVFDNTPADCYGCHQKDDVHGGGLGQKCEECHNTVSWPEAQFNHALTDFPLTGEHQQVTCEQCHIENVFDGTPTDCYGCHQKDDAHNGQFGQACEQCHTAATWEGATFDHNLTNFPLTGEHRQVTCEQCHIDDTFAGTPTNCYGCHQKDDAHNGQFGQACEQCHTTVTWEDATFDHNLTNFPLTGAHERTACEKCHIDDTFAGTPTNCYGCHAKDDDHDGRFGQKCELCHSTKAWEPATFTGRDHTFPIKHGRSENSPCETCHPTVLDQYTCYGCHEHTPDNIRGEHLEEGIRDFEDCFACHPDGREHDD